MVRKLLTGLLLLAPLAGAADTSLLDFIMPDARVVFGLDLARLRESQAHASLTNSLQNANPELQKLLDALGFDPVRDLQEVLFASPGIGKNPPALVVARGTFDTAKLRAFAEASGSKLTEFAGVPILSDPGRDSGAFALLDNLVLAGNREQVEAALGRRGRGMILNSEMATRIAALSRRYDAWLVSIAPLATMASNLPPDAKMEGLTNTAALRSIEQFSLGVTMRADIALDAEVVMTDGKAAESLASSIQMLLSMVQKSGAEQPGLMNALKNLNFGVERNVVHLGFSVPAEEVEKAVMAALDKQRGKKGPLTTAARQPATDAPPAAVPEPRIQDTAPPPVIQQAQIQEPPIAPEVAQPLPSPARPAPRASAPVTRSPRIPSNGEILIQSSPKDMGTVVILGAKK